MGDTAAPDSGSKFTKKAGDASSIFIYSLKDAKTLHRAMGNCGSDEALGFVTSAVPLSFSYIALVFLLVNLQLAEHLAGCVKT